MTEINKKIAILSMFNFGTNYGETLQNYGLQKYLKNNGYEPISVYYREKYEKDTVKKVFKIPQLNIFYEWYIEMKRRGMGKGVLYYRKELFNQFCRKYINYTVPCYTINAIEKICYDYPIFICGSDMIWHPRMYKPGYSLDFFWNKSIKRIAYAPSISKLELSDEDEEKIKNIVKCIERFDYISVREKISLDILKKYTSVPIEVVLDPTFLLDVAEWKEIESPRLIKEEYMLCYMLYPMEKDLISIRTIAEKQGIKRVIFLNIDADYVKDKDFKYKVGPAEFLSLIHYCKYIYTNSYHGTIFSLIYKKNFIVFNPQVDWLRKDTRIKDLLTIIGLESRFFDKPSEIRELLPPVNYQKIDMQLNRIIIHSKEYLLNALSTWKNS